MALVNDGQVLGSGTRDLVLQTRGKIYIKVGDRYYNFDYKNSDDNSIKRVNNLIEEHSENLLGSSETLKNYVDKTYLNNTLQNYVTERAWKDVVETQEMLKNAVDGYSDAISPIALNTMQIVVGNEQLQFEFVTSFTNDTVVSAPIYFQDNTLYCGIENTPYSYIRHWTLETSQDTVQSDIDSTTYDCSESFKKYWRWKIESEEFFLENDDSPYYLYIKVPYVANTSVVDIYSKTNANLEEDGENGAVTETGKFMLTYDPLSFTAEDDPGYFYLLLAIVNTPVNGVRSVTTMNGYTEITPGQIRAYRFASPDGNSYMDFIAEELKLGNKLHFYTDDDGNPQLEIKDGGFTAGEDGKVCIKADGSGKIGDWIEWNSDGELVNVGFKHYKIPLEGYTSESYLISSKNSDVEIFSPFTELYGMVNRINLNFEAGDYRNYDSHKLSIFNRTRLPVLLYSFNNDEPEGPYMDPMAYRYIPERSSSWRSDHDIVIPYGENYDPFILQGGSMVDISTIPHESFFSWPGIGAVIHQQCSEYYTAQVSSSDSSSAVNPGFHVLWTNGSETMESESINITVDYNNGKIIIPNSTFDSIQIIGISSLDKLKYECENYVRIIEELEAEQDNGGGSRRNHYIIKAGGTTIKDYTKFYAFEDISSYKTSTITVEATSSRNSFRMYLFKKGQAVGDISLYYSNN